MPVGGEWQSVDDWRPHEGLAEWLRTSVNWRYAPGNGRCSVARVTRFRRVIELPQRRAVELTEDEIVLDVAFAHCQRVAEDVYNIGARFMDRWYTKLPEAA